MEKISVALTIVLFLSLLTAIRGEANRFDLRVIGGEPCSTTTHKYIVSLVRKEEPNNFCAGTLIKLNWVLSSAKCLAPYKESPSIIKVSAGISTKNPLGTQSATPEKIFIDETTGSYDIGLIFFREPFVQQEDTDIIELIGNKTEGDMSTFCDKATGLGWGIPQPRKPVTPASQFTGDLNCVELSVMSERECNDSRAWLPPVPGAAFCLFSKEKKDVCDGDRGGPIVCKDVLVGVVSEGKCASPRMPSLHSRIDAHLDFIKTTLEYVPSGTPKPEDKGESKLDPNLEQKENEKQKEGQKEETKDEQKEDAKPEEKPKEGKQGKSEGQTLHIKDETKEEDKLKNGTAKEEQKEGGVMDEKYPNLKPGKQPNQEQKEKPKPEAKSKTNYNRPSIMLFLYIILYHLLKLYY